MGNYYGERRKHERIYFGKKRLVECEFSLEGSESDMISGFILNLSEGGIHFIQERKGMKIIQKSDRIILKTVHRPEPLNFSQDIEMQVKWILDHNEFLRYVCYGCMFLNLPQDKIELIRIMVADYVMGTNVDLGQFAGLVYETANF